MKSPQKPTLGVAYRKLLRIHLMALHYPRLILGAFGLFLILCLVPMGNLKMLLSVDELVDSDFETYEALHSLNNEYLNQDEIFLVLQKAQPGLWTKKEICSLESWIHQRVDTSNNLNAIISSLGLQLPNETATEFSFFPILAPNCTSSNSDEQVIAEGFEKLKNSPWSGVLISKEQSDLSVLLYPDARNATDFFGSFNAQVIDELQSTVKAEILDENPSIEAVWVGDGLFEYYMKEGYETMPLLNTLMSLFAMLFCRWVLGTWKSGLLIVSFAFWASIPVYAGMSILGHPIDILSSALSLMIFVASIEDFIFLSQLRKQKHWRATFRKMLLPSFLTSITTVIGFGSLIFADIDIIRRFGLWAAVGSLFEWIILFLVFPALLQNFKWFRNWTCPEKVWPWPKRLSSGISLRPPRFLKFASLVVFPLALVSPWQLYISDSPQLLFPDNHVMRQDMNKIEASRHWRGTVSIVFSDFNDRDKNLKVIEEIKTWPFVKNLEDPYTIRDYIKTDVSKPLQGFVDQLIDEHTITDRLGPTNLDEFRAVLFVESIDLLDTQMIRQKINEICEPKQCWPAGNLISYGELGTRVMTTLYKSLGISLLLVCSIIGLLCWYLKPKSLVPLLGSVVWGPAALLSCFFVFQIPIYYITSMIASIVVGVAGDNAIQYLFFTKDEDLNSGLNSLAPSALLVGLAMCLASSVFFFGYFAPMKNLGGLLITGFILSMVGDIWVLRSFLRAKKS